MNLAQLKQGITQIRWGLNHLLWPAVCISCEENICETENGLCKNCWGELVECTGLDYCPRCGCEASKYAIVAETCPNCIGKEINFCKIARAGVYWRTLQKMILDFKFKGRTELDLLLGLLADSALQGSSFFNDIDFFVPVPLHWFRRFFRGYNQSMIIARKINHPSAKMNTDLVRTRNTKAQVVMTSPTKRAANVAGAFAVRKGHQFRGKNVCLVDDIKTTGATLNECAKVLKEACAEKVYAVVLAVAGQSGEITA